MGQFSIRIFFAALYRKLHNGDIMRTIKYFFFGILFLSTIANAQTNISANVMDELDPRAENIEESLQKLDEQYFEETGKLPFLFPSFLEILCRRWDCPVYVEIRKSEQQAYLYYNGSLQYVWLVSTGLPKSETPIWEGHPNGRIYDAYTSMKNPGGDYQGLGNMPYAVFLYGGYALHGTTEKNFPKLGKKASHGCVRLHPDNGKIFNRLVRSQGIAATWVSVID